MKKLKKESRRFTTGSAETQTSIIKYTDLYKSLFIGNAVNCTQKQLLLWNAAASCQCGKWKRGNSTQTLSFLYQYTAGRSVSDRSAWDQWTDHVNKTEHTHLTNHSSRRWTLQDFPGCLRISQDILKRGFPGSLNIRAQTGRLNTNLYPWQ